MSEEQKRPRPSAGHRIPDDQWAKVQADAERFAAEPAPEPLRVQLDQDGEPGEDVGGRPRAAGPRTVAAVPPLLDWTARGRASGKYFPVSGRPTQLVVFHSMEAPLANGYAQSVTNWALPSLAAGGPEASWHRSYGPDYRVHFVPDELGAWHASEANPLSIGLEQTGYAAYTRAQWTTPEGLRMLEGVGYDVAQICKRDGIPARWLTTAEVRAVLDGGNRQIKGFCFHRQVDPETRTDPGNGYPADLALAAVKRHLGTAPTPPPTGDISMADAKSLEAQVKRLETQLREVLAALAPIGTSSGEVSLRQFIAWGTRAAQAAEDNTGPINTSAGQETLRSFIAKGTRAAEAAAAQTGALQAAIAALTAQRPAGAGGLSAEEITRAAQDGAAKALEDLKVTTTIEQGETKPLTAVGPRDGDEDDIDGPTARALLDEAQEGRRGEENG